MLGIFILPLIAAVVATILGMIWFGPLFGNHYMRVMGINPEMALANKKSMMPKMLLDFVLSFVMFLGLLMILNIAQAGSYGAALIFTLLFWGFIMLPTKASSVIWSNKTTKDAWVLFGLTAGYSLITFVVSAVLFIALVPLFV